MITFNWAGLTPPGAAVKRQVAVWVLGMHHISNRLGTREQHDQPIQTKGDTPMGWCAKR